MGRSRGRFQSFHTTLLDLVRAVSDALPEDAGATEVVAELVRRGWLRTADGLAVVLSHEDEPVPAPLRMPTSSPRAWRRIPS
jgi:hypothetical protein